MTKQLKLTLLALIIFGVNAIAQNFPYGINYQGVARDVNGNAQTNTSVPLRFTINKATSGGTIMWQETQTSNSNAMGQFIAIIGTGVRQPASLLLNFSDMNWANDSYFLTVEIQTGISTFVIIGTQQFMSVPYALAAPDPTPAGAIIAFGGVSFMDFAGKEYQRISDPFGIVKALPVDEIPFVI